ncbi:MAG TPA: hypothetical protein VFE34_12220 [Dongiaceae bacterium]|jgi:hypothetical protein|nr:hypothetical protein [Dongiaceae bacterium]
MTWTPYSIEELENLLKAEQADFTADEHAKFNRTKVPVRKVRCFRSGPNAGDGLFVVASDGKTTIIFDDVEGEFGICKSNAIEADVVREWGLAGSLVFALMHLK